MPTPTNEAYNYTVPPSPTNAAYNYTVATPTITAYKEVVGCNEPCGSIITRDFFSGWGTIIC
jgi:hypothetical protein